MGQSKASITCNNIEDLIKSIKEDYADATEKKESLYTQFVFKCGLIINIYNTGGITFQGKDCDNDIKDRLLTMIKLVNTKPNNK